MSMPENDQPAETGAEAAEQEPEVVAHSAEEEDLPAHCALYADS
jgi:hypothetical protein